MVVAAALIVLQIHVKFELNDGKWTVEVEKKPIDFSLLKCLVK